MKNKIQEANEKISRSQMFRQESTRLIREMMDDFRAKKSAIYNNRELSDEGKQKKIAKLQAEYEVKAIELSRAIYDEHNGNLAEAKKIAESILTGKLPKVDDAERTLFMQKAEELIAKALFASNSNNAKEALRTLVDMTNNPTLAEEIRPQVLSLSQQVILSVTNPTEALSLRKELGKLYSDISDKALPEGGREAREIMSLVNAISQTPIMSDLVRNALAEVSPLAKHYANNPHEYFDKQMNKGVEE